MKISITRDKEIRLKCETYLEALFLDDYFNEEKNIKIRQVKLGWEEGLGRPDTKTSELIISSDVSTKSNKQSS